MSYKITDLSANSSPAVGDLVPNVDISDTTQSANGSTKKTTLQQIADFLASLAQTLTNKTLTSPVINTGVSGTAIKDEDTMTSDSATAVPTQQSTKAYVDTHAADTSTHGVATVADAADLTTHMADTTTHGATGAIVGVSDTQTLTNKRVTKRVTAITSAAEPTINTDNCDCVDITALAAAITSMTTNLSGTPTNKQLLEFEIKDDGTARAITWGASFTPGGTALPTTTVISKILTVLFQYSTANSLNKWRCIGSQQEV